MNISIRADDLQGCYRYLQSVNRHQDVVDLATPPINSKNIPGAFSNGSRCSHKPVRGYRCEKKNFVDLQTHLYQGKQISSECTGAFPKVPGSEQTNWGFGLVAIGQNKETNRLLLPTTRKELISVLCMAYAKKGKV